LPIYDPNICRIDRESQITPLGNPESSQDGNALGPGYDQDAPEPRARPGARSSLTARRGAGFLGNRQALGPPKLT